MEQRLLTIIENTPMNMGLVRLGLRVAPELAAAVKPGQFINIRIGGTYLRRPISVNDVSGDVLTVIYRVVGEGTEKLRLMQPGERLDVLLPLGNGFSTAESGESPLLIGGGAGAAPLYYLAKKLAAEGKKLSVILAFNTAEDIFLKEGFEALGADVRIATVDGGYGTKGFATDIMKDMDYSYIYTCGPEPMMKAVFRAAKSSAQFSFESRMGCGFGACMGCSCRTIAGYKRICKDGPVMRKEELLWED